MKYLCLIFSDPKEAERLFDRDWKALEAEHLAYDETLRRSGHFIAAEALQPAEAVTTVRVRNGKLSVTDGPFIETKEQLGGFFLIVARDLNEAILLASKIPSARLGSVEVRPVRELQQM
jgi:hypothetical protein